MQKRYFKWISSETEIAKIFQNYLEIKTWCKSYLAKRKKANDSIDFLGRIYDFNTNKTVKELAVEVRTLFFTKKKLNELNDWFLHFPISKLNEMMTFLRIKKNVYIVYRLWWEEWKIYFISFDYYLNHNFKLKKIFIKKENGFNKEEYVLLIPLRNLIFIYDCQSQKKKYSYNS